MNTEATEGELFDRVAITDLIYAYCERFDRNDPDGFLWGRSLHRYRRTEAGWRIAALLLQAAGTIDFHRERMHGIGRA